MAKEYMQDEGMDFEQVFVPVARMESMRLLIALAAQESWKIHCMDVKSTVLNGGDVYVNQPPSFIKEGEGDVVLKLHKVLYGRRQDLRVWNIKLDRTLISLGFEKATLEHTMYKRGEGSDRLLVGIYDDDLLITGANEDVIAKFKLQMKELFKMDDLGLLSCYLGPEVHQKPEGITICQEGYARKVLESCGMKDCNPINASMEPRLELSKKEMVKLLGYSDSNKEEIVDGRNSTSDVAYFLGGSVVSWLSRKQKMVTSTSSEAECQGVWLGRLHNDLMDRDPKQVVLKVDSESMFFLREDPVRRDRSKHIDTMYHYMKDWVEEEKTEVNYNCTDDQLADIRTKALDREKFLKMQRRIGVEAVT